ncbi:NAD-dependent succinate-semialdehyde dehydrogenase [Pararhodobacter sp. CCB-MM2]|uniref:NAD-dependent succinate-semialdehyde dehydrogenase n=1 Tax=Pararhodobacter sp. CCB-MM2 TaxID=1786003 RepID=UPI0008313E0F|nr:NAD-dependent succinate-semialdehyde dehydrogenase [Pararhodobacter sp. CCB-MM2]
MTAAPLPLDPALTCPFPAVATRIPVLDPATAQPMGDVPDLSVAEAMAALDRAEAAAAGWAATAPRQRSEILRRAFELMIARRERLALLMVRENGKAMRDALAEVDYAAEFFRWFAEEAVRAPGDYGTSPAGTGNILVKYHPVGIALLITPWNFPAAMATRKIGPALAAGCTCLLKPATETPLTAYAIAGILSEAGLPEGVVSVVSTRQTGAVVDALLDDPRVRKLSFTGSTPVGRMLLEKASRQVINCSMELGGDAPLIVFDSADLQTALDGAMIAKMRNGGQACTAANRLFVQSAIAPAFIEAFTARMAGLTLGPGDQPGVDCGPVVSAKALTGLQRLIDDAVERGATVLAGGARGAGEGYFLAPTVLTDIPADAEIATAEIFGPIAALQIFDTEDEVIARANATEYGLAGYVFSGDLAQAMRVADRLECGMIGINKGAISDPAAPFGGVKQSGLGREGGRHGMQEFMEPRYVAVSW